VQLAKLSGSERELHFHKEKLRVMGEEMLQMEIDAEMVKLRLVDIDPYYKQFTQIFENLIRVLKSQKLSPMQIF